jgi:choline monooxygenase
MSGFDHTPLAGRDLGAVLADLQASAAQPFPEAGPMPAALFHAQSFHQREIETIFAREWICLGRADDVPHAGDFTGHDIAGVPVLAVRQPDGAIKVLLNACAHRRARVTDAATGNAERLICPYHGWTYDCTGRLVAAPFMKTVPGFDMSAHRLVELHSELWQGFIYASLSPEAPEPVAQRLAGFHDDIVGRFAMTDYVGVMRETMSWDCNWKNLIENFTESYHVPIAHRETFAYAKRSLDHYTCSEGEDWCSYHWGDTPPNDGADWDGAVTDRDLGDWDRRVVVACIFPSHLITLTANMLWYITVQPHGVGRFNAQWGVSAPQPVLDSAGDNWLTELRRFMDRANDEDKPLCEALYRGTAAPNPPPGRYHPIERNIWDFTRYLARLTGGLDA